jgi:cystathionine beta-lyase/cystathionine gamma-synthase
MKFATKAIHAGQEADARTGAVIVPIYQTSTYKQDGIDRPRNGYEYARTQNPTRGSLEETLAALDDGKHGLAYGSGSAATSALIDLLTPGQEVISTIDVYGGTYRQLRRVYAKYGIESTFLDTHDADAILGRVTAKTRMILIETPTNPMLNVVDIQKVADQKPDHVILVVDNTFASPALQRPLALGADVVLYSTTKYIGGHSDVVGGALVTNRDDIRDAGDFYRNAVGNIPGPFDCFLVQKGIKTLALRMERHSANAARIARFLTEHPKADEVYYPGLPDHPGHLVARQQMSDFGGMVSFQMKGGRPAVDAFVEKLQIFTLAESLGGVESLVCYPTRMTHHAIPEAEKQKIGITDALIRLSVGIEDIDDLLVDLERALG